MQNVLPRTAFALMGFVFLALEAGAQPVIGTGAPADEAAIAASRSKAVDNLTSAPTSHPNSPLFQWGPISFRPSLHYQYVYADGLNTARGHNSSSYIQSVTPTLLLDADKRWTLTYAPSFVAYSNPAFRDTVAQFVNGQGQWVQPGWSASVAQQYSKTDTPLIETARQTGQQTATTRAAVNWFESDLSYGVSADQQLNFIEGLSDTFSWFVQPNANYRIAPTLSVGVAAAAGYVLVYHASDLKSLRPTVHTHWQMSSKTGFDASIGYDRWRFVSGNRHDVSGLYYDAALSWQVFTWTSLTASAGQSNSTAPFQNQVTRNHKLSFGLRQRLLQHFQLELTADEQNTDYVLDKSALETARADRIRSYSVRLSTTFLRRGTAAFLYRRNKNSSSQPGFGFSSGQIGFELGFAY